VTKRDPSSIATLVATAILIVSSVGVVALTATPAFATSPASPGPLPIGAKVLGAGQVAQIPTPGTSLTTPVDGRLRGPDFTAQVTGVAWPTAAGSSSRLVAGAAHRLVVFTLTMTQPAAATATSIGLSPVPAPVAELDVSGQSLPIDLTGIENQIYQSMSSQTETGTGTSTFAVSVPASAHPANLVLTQSWFSQGFDLWALARNQPYPTVLYRDPTMQSVSANPSAGASIPITNPADGFSSPAVVTITSATLNAFPPTGPAQPPASDDAYLIVSVSSTYPEDPTDPTAGHYFSDMVPLPGSGLIFSPPGQPAVSATAINPASQQAQQQFGGHDDGLLDATYSFVVPAGTTSGTLTVAAAQTNGFEYTHFIANSNVPLQVSGPTDFPLTFPAIPAVSTQPKPPWVGAPLPPTGSNVAQAGGAAGDSGGSGSGGGFPVWLAVVILAIAAAGVVIAQQVVRRRRPDQTRAQAVAIPIENEPANPAEGPPLGSGDAPGNGSTDRPGGTPPSPTFAPPPPVPLAAQGRPVVSIMGPVEVDRWRQPPERAVITHLGSFLATHADRPVTSDRLLLALWPTESDRQEVTKKTLHNYLSTLRRDIGPEYFPDAVNTGGYRFVGVVTDWQRFSELSSEADGVNGSEADRLRSDALSLVRGQPFEGAPSPTYDWVNTEALGTTITVAVVGVAHRVATDLLAKRELAHAEWAAGQGLKASPTEEVLWVDRAQAIRATGNAMAEQRFWRDAAATLGSETADRLKGNLDGDE
jgi:hypothetical protein